MKKITSVAALALRLTWLRVTGLFILTGAAQWIAFAMNFDQARALKYQMDDLPAFIGKLGMLALMLLLGFSVQGGKGGTTAYTLRRLSVSEWTVTAVWSLVFAGYFVMYWLFQIGMMLGMYTKYASVMGGENRLFLAAWRSAYFHYLMPLAEPWGYARNIAMVLGFGSAAALSAQNTRNGRWNPLCMGLVMTFFCVVLIPREMASQGLDAAAVAAVVICTVVDWVWSWRWMHDEAN